MNIGAAVDCFFSNPALPQLAMLACAFAAAVSPRLLILGASVFLGATSLLIGTFLLLGFWGAGIAPPLVVGTFGGLFVGWRLARRVRWFWFTGAKRRAFHRLLALAFVLASVTTLFWSQIEEYRLMRRLIAADQTDRLAILKEGYIPTMDDVPFFLDRFATDERKVIFQAMLDGSETFWSDPPATFSDLIQWAVDQRDKPLVGVGLNWLNDQDYSHSWLVQHNWSADELRFLIESGLEILEKDKNGSIFAEEAIMKNNSRISDWFPVLMEATPNLPEMATSDGVRTFMELLAFEDQAHILADLTNLGFDLAVRGRNNRTLVHHLAIGSKGADSIPVLIAAGIDVNVLDHYGLAAIHYASFHNESLARLFLSASCPINAPNEKGETPLFLAVDFDRDMPFSDLPDMQNLTDNQAGDEIASALLKTGANPCQNDRWGNNALHYALMKKNGDRLSPDIVAMLLEQGADPLFANKKGSTPRSILTPYLRNSSNDCDVDSLDYCGPDIGIEKTVAILKKAEEGLGVP